MSAEKSCHWYVMTLHDMKRFQAWLKEENARRLGSGKALIEPFYPQEFLRADADMAADFARLVFLKASAADLCRHVEMLRESHPVIRLSFYRDTDRRPAIVPDQRMRQFLDACIKFGGQMEMTLPLGGIEARDRVRIKSGPFSGNEALVTGVRLVRGALQLELEMQLVAGVMSIKMSNVNKSHVTIIDRQGADVIRTDFIEYTQNHLLTILSHRAKRISDEDVVRADADMLTRLYRYRHYDIANEAARHHFQALMLICAHLCRYKADEETLRGQVETALARINQRSQSKAASDVRTYLWVALYISTQQPAYRDAAKQYIHDQQPKSPKLRHLVALIRSGRTF